MPELKRGYTRKRDDLWLDDGPQLVEMPDAVTVTKKRRRNQLSVQEQRDIVATVKELKLSHAQAAIRFGITTLLVSKLVTESRKPEFFLVKAAERETKRRQKYRAVVEQSLRLLNSDSGLRKAEEVAEVVHSESGFKVSQPYVCAVLKKDLGVTYQAIKRIPYRGNSTRCLALR